MSWNDERVDAAEKRCGPTGNPRQIAKELGGVTRNAVIARCIVLALEPDDRNARGGGTGQARGRTPARGGGRTGHQSRASPRPIRPRPEPETPRHVNERPRPVPAPRPT